MSNFLIAAKLSAKAASTHIDCVNGAVLPAPLISGSRNAIKGTICALHVNSRLAGVRRPRFLGHLDGDVVDLVSKLKAEARSGHQGL